MSETLSGQDLQMESKTTQFQSSSHTKGKEPPSVEVTISINDDEEDYGPDFTHRVHQRKYVGKKCFKCAFCGQRFNSLFELNRHSMTGCSEDCIKEKTIEVKRAKTMEYSASAKAERIDKATTDTEKNSPGASRISSDDEIWCPASLQQACTSDTPKGELYKSSRMKICSSCGQAFTSSVELTSHMRVHIELEESPTFVSNKNVKFRKDSGEKSVKSQIDVQSIQNLNEQKDSGEKSVTTLIDVQSIQNLKEQNEIKECAVLLQRLSPERDQSLLLSSEICTVTVGSEIPEIKAPPNMIEPCNLNSSAEATENSTGTDSGPQANQSEPDSSASTMKCAVCNQACPDVFQLHRHYFRSHVVNGSFICSGCKTTFVRLTDIVNHYKNQRQYQCASCMRCFTKHTWKCHIVRFNDTCKTPTIYDPGMYKNSASCSKNVEPCEADIKNEPPVCLHCDKTFSSKHTLQVHLARHTGGFSCPICDKVFNQKTYLRRHMDRHSGKEPYLCEICGQGMPTLRYLEVHMLKHTNERPFKCEQCDQAFKRDMSLRLHIRNRHTDLRPYACHFCDKTYKQSGALRLHMMKHTGDYLYNCLKCGKGFGRLCLFRKHRKEICI